MPDVWNTSQSNDEHITRVGSFNIFNWTTIWIYLISMLRFKMTRLCISVIFILNKLNFRSRFTNLSNAPSLYHQLNDNLGHIFVNLDAKDLPINTSRSTATHHISAQENLFMEYGRAIVGHHIRPAIFLPKKCWMCYLTLWRKTSGNWCILDARPTPLVRITVYCAE